MNEQQQKRLRDLIEDHVEKYSNYQYLQTSDCSKSTLEFAFKQKIESKIELDAFIDSLVE